MLDSKCISCRLSELHHVYCNLAGSVHRSVYDFPKRENMGTNKVFLISCYIISWNEYSLLSEVEGLQPPPRPPCPPPDSLPLGMYADIFVGWRRENISVFIMV